jgi:hypothetical protein
MKFRTLATKMHSHFFKNCIYKFWSIRDVILDLKIHPMDLMVREVTSHCNSALKDFISIDLTWFFKELKALIVGP